MSGSVNKHIIVGHLGADPEVRRTNNGDAIVNLRIATSESWKDKTSGERKDKTEWHSVVIFNKSLAEVAEKYLKKGAKVYVEGKIRSRKWEDTAGNTRYSTETVLDAFRGELQLLDKRESNRAPAAQSQDDYGQQRTTKAGGYGEQSGGFSHDLDDDIPF